MVKQTRRVKKAPVVAPLSDEDTQPYQPGIPPEVMEQWLQSEVMEQWLKSQGKGVRAGSVEGTSFYVRRALGVVTFTVGLALLVSPAFVAPIPWWAILFGGAVTLCTGFAVMAEGRRLARKRVDDPAHSGYDHKTWIRDGSFR